MKYVDPVIPTGSTYGAAFASVVGRAFPTVALDGEQLEVLRHALDDRT